MEFIPVNTPLLDGNEKKYLCECIDTGWISSEGSFVKRLETGIADYVGRKYGVAVCNGSVALDLAVEALELEKGDEEDQREEQALYHVPHQEVCGREL